MNNKVHNEKVYYSQTISIFIVMYSNIHLVKYPIMLAVSRDKNTEHNFIYKFLYINVKFTTIRSHITKIVDQPLSLSSLSVHDVLYYITGISPITIFKCKATNFYNLYCMNDFFTYIII